MRVLIAAAIAAFALTTTAAHADLRYYVDQDVLRKNHSTTLLDRAMRDIGRNTNRLVASVVRAADGDVGRSRSQPSAGLGALREGHDREAWRHRRYERTCGHREGGQGRSSDPGLRQSRGQEREPQSRDRKLSHGPLHRLSGAIATLRAGRARLLRLASPTGCAAERACRCCDGLQQSSR